MASDRTLRHSAGQLSVVALAACVWLADAPTAWAQEPAAPLQQIQIESVSGTVHFVRGGAFRRMNVDSSLRSGDKVVCNAGAVCKLVFRSPATGAILSASILTGYAELDIDIASIQGNRPRTELGLRQGVLRSGVVRTAVPPSFRVRTPRSVVAVRGTEIREISASDDRGDLLRMGVVGSAWHLDTTLVRSAVAGQTTRKSTETDPRGGQLMRAIEYASMTHPVPLYGPHLSVAERNTARRLGFLGGYNLMRVWKGEGNPRRDQQINQSAPPPHQNRKPPQLIITNGNK